jgi:hypothetical protein
MREIVFYSNVAHFMLLNDMEDQHVCACCGMSIFILDIVYGCAN